LPMKVVCLIRIKAGKWVRTGWMKLMKG